MLKGGVRTIYTYGADGFRTQKQYGTTTYNYYYVDGQLVRMTWANSYIDFLYDESGSIYSIVYDGDQYYFVKNLQGDVVQIYSIWGTKLVEYDYDAWGNCTVVYEHSSYGDLAEINPIRYRGYVYDFETGFYYLNSRYYDPQVRRFINADSASLIGTNDDFISMNLYTYCGNNPTLRADGDGEFWHIVIGAAVGAVVSAGITLATNIATGKEWSDGLGVAAVTGALSAGLAATGAGAIVQFAGNALISAGESIYTQGQEKGYDNINYGEVIVDSVIGGISGSGNSIGKGNGKHLMREGINLTKKVFKKGIKKSVKYYVSQTATIFYKPLFNSAVSDFIDSTYDNIKNHYKERLIEEYYNGR